MKKRRSDWAAFFVLMVVFDVSYAGLSCRSLYSHECPLKQLCVLQVFAIRVNTGFKLFASLSLRETGKTTNDSEVF